MKMCWKVCFLITLLIVGLSWLLSSCGQRDAVVFYFSGFACRIPNHSNRNPLLQGSICLQDGCISFSELTREIIARSCHLESGFQLTLLFDCPLATCMFDLDWNHELFDPLLVRDNIGGYTEEELLLGNVTNIQEKLSLLSTNRLLEPAWLVRPARAVPRLISCSQNPARKTLQQPSADEIKIAESKRIAYDSIVADWGLVRNAPTDSERSFFRSTRLFLGAACHSGQTAHEDVLRDAYAQSAANPQSKGAIFHGDFTRQLIVHLLTSDDNGKHLTFASLGKRVTSGFLMDCDERHEKNGGIPFVYQAQQLPVWMFNSRTKLPDASPSKALALLPSTCFDNRGKLNRLTNSVVHSPFSNDLCRLKEAADLLTVLDAKLRLVESGISEMEHSQLLQIRGENASTFHMGTISNSGMLINQRKMLQDIKDVDAAAMNVSSILMNSLLKANDFISNGISQTNFNSSIANRNNEDLQRLILTMNLPSSGVGFGEDLKRTSKHLGDSLKSGLVALIEAVAFSFAAFNNPKRSTSWKVGVLSLLEEVGGGRGRDAGNRLQLIAENLNRSLSDWFAPKGNTGKQKNNNDVEITTYKGVTSKGSLVNKWLNSGPRNHFNEGAIDLDQLDGGNSYKDKLFSGANLQDRLVSDSKSKFANDQGLIWSLKTEEGKKASDVVLSAIDSTFGNGLGNLKRRLSEIHAKWSLGYNSAGIKHSDGVVGALLYVRKIVDSVDLTNIGVAGQYLNQAFSVDRSKNIPSLPDNTDIDDTSRIRNYAKVHFNNEKDILYGSEERISTDARQLKPPTVCKSISEIESNNLVPGVLLCRPNEQLIRQSIPCYCLCSREKSINHCPSGNATYLMNHYNAIVRLTPVDAARENGTSASENGFLALGSNQDVNGDLVDNSIHVIDHSVSNSNGGKTTKLIMRKSGNMADEASHLFDLALAEVTAHLLRLIHLRSCLMMARELLHVDRKWAFEEGFAASYFPIDPNSESYVALDNALKVTLAQMKKNDESSILAQNFKKSLERSQIDEYVKSAMTDEIQNLESNCIENGGILSREFICDRLMHLSMFMEALASGPRRDEVLDQIGSSIVQKGGFGFVGSQGKKYQEVTVVDGNNYNDNMHGLKTSKNPLSNLSHSIYKLKNEADDILIQVKQQEWKQVDAHLDEIHNSELFQIMLDEKSQTHSSSNSPSQTVFLDSQHISSSLQHQKQSMGSILDPSLIRMRKEKDVIAQRRELQLENIRGTVSPTSIDTRMVIPLNEEKKQYANLNVFYPENHSAFDQFERSQSYKSSFLSNTHNGVGINNSIESNNGSRSPTMYKSSSPSQNPMPMFVSESVPAMQLDDSSYYNHDHQGLINVLTDKIVGRLNNQPSVKKESAASYLPPTGSSFIPNEGRNNYNLAPLPQTERSETYLNNGKYVVVTSPRNPFYNHSLSPFHQVADMDDFIIQSSGFNSKGCSNVGLGLKHHQEQFTTAKKSIAHSSTSFSQPPSSSLGTRFISPSFSNISKEEPFWWWS